MGSGSLYFLAVLKTVFNLFLGLPPGYLKAVWPEFFGSVFGVWAAPGGFKTIQKCGGLRPPHFWMILKPPEAAQTPKTDPNKSGQTAFRYPACPQIASLVPRKFRRQAIRISGLRNVIWGLMGGF